MGKHFMKRLQHWSIAALGGVMLTGSTLSWAAEDDAEASAGAETLAYEASYVLTRRGSERGDASRILEQLDDGTWRYYTVTSASLLFLSDHRENETIFRMQDGRVVPESFEYSRSGTGSDRALNVRFDRENERIVDASGNEVDIEWDADLLDPNAVLHQLQLDVAGGDDSWMYSLVDEKGNQRDYEFARVKTETLNLPYGEVEAIRIDRVRESDRRQTYFWFAPELNYTMVRMQQIKEGKEQAQIELTNLQFE
ncbi:hypothetical protein CWE14_08055 [Aliidiomarina soli]|uniref:DUF3108 domain-containing protein n=2 Tax=Aliidiomarina soli TaxID=1928574 RepID=A0A432WH96_9GAMM|nr:hypothetical protein CWE14_08055 [Aliidiomarina soli]